MSRNEWERGTFILSVAEYNKFKKEFFARWNTQLEKDFETISRLYADLKAAGKGKRGFDWVQALEDLLRKSVTNYGRYASSTPVYNIKTMDSWDIERMLLNKRVETKHPSTGHVMVRFEKCPPVSPKKGDFKALSPRKVTQFSQHEAGLGFNNEQRKLDWSVSENNHACDTAHESFLGQLFFELLGKVVWTRGTGGEIYGNDEYNEDNARDGCGGGGSYSKGVYGPDTKKNSPRYFR